MIDPSVSLRTMEMGESIFDLRGFVCFWERRQPGV